MRSFPSGEMVAWLTAVGNWSVCSTRDRSNENMRAVSSLLLSILIGSTNDQA